MHFLLNNNSINCITANAVIKTVITLKRTLPSYQSNNSGTANIKNGPTLIVKIIYVKIIKSLDLDLINIFRYNPKTIQLIAEQKVV